MTYVAFPLHIAAKCSWSFVYCVITLCASLFAHVYCFTVCVFLSCILQLLDAGQKSVSGRSCDQPLRHRFFLVSLCVYKRMLRWFPRLQVATTCFSCSPPDLSFLDPHFIFMYTHYNHCHRALWRCDPTRVMASSFLRFSRSHTTTQHSRQDSCGRMISSSQRPLPDNTRHSQQKNIHAPGGIRTYDPSRRAAADLRPRLCGHWDRLNLLILLTI